MLTAACAPGCVAAHGHLAAWPQTFCLEEPLPVHLVGQELHVQHAGLLGSRTTPSAASDSGREGRRGPCGRPAVSPRLGHRTVATSWQSTHADAILGESPSRRWLRLAGWRGCHGGGPVLRAGRPHRAGGGGLMTRDAGQPSQGFGGLLRGLRMNAGLTQEELAETARMSARSVSDLERGVSRTARPQTARLLADALDLAGPERARFLALSRGQAPEDAPVPGGSSAVALAAVAATRALPRDIAGFTGRAGELDWLMTRLAGAARRGRSCMHVGCSRPRSSQRRTSLPARFPSS